MGRGQAVATDGSWGSSLAARKLTESRVTATSLPVFCLYCATASCTRRAVTWRTSTQQEGGGHAELPPAQVLPTEERPDDGK